LKFLIRYGVGVAYPGVAPPWSVGVQISTPIYPVPQYLILIFILEYVVGMVKL